METMESLLDECKHRIDEFTQSQEKFEVYITEGKGSFIELYDETRENWNCLKTFFEKYSIKEIQDKMESMERKIIHSFVRFAVFKESAENLEYLFLKGGKLNFEEPENRFPPLLHEAVGIKDLRKVALLLKNGADVNVEQHNPATLPELIWNEPLPFKKGTTALHRAIVTMQDEMVQLLLDHGADISKADMGQDTAMHHAARMGDLKIVELLCDRGASIGGMDDYDLSPLDHAINRDHKDVFLFLLDRLTDNRNVLLDQALCVAANNSGKMEIVKILLEAGANVNARDEANGLETALYYAAENKDLELAEFLLDRGAEIDLADFNDETPLQVSIQYDNMPIIQLLLRQGADVNSKNFRGRTCLHTAAELGYFDIVEVLLNNQADFFAKDEENQNALSLALEGGYSEGLERISTCKYLVRWMIEMQLDTSRCAVELNDIKSDPEYKDIKEYLVECEEEMLSIKSEEIEKTYVRYYDVIDKLSLAQLVKLSRNENIVEAFELNSLSAKFPIFASMLHKPYQQAVERRKLLEKARQVFCSVYDCNDRKHPILPYFFTQDVFELLSNEDLINLTLDF